MSSISLLLDEASDSTHCRSVVSGRWARLRCRRIDSCTNRGYLRFTEERVDVCLCDPLSVDVLIAQGNFTMGCITSVMDSKIVLAHQC